MEGNQLQEKKTLLREILMRDDAYSNRSCPICAEEISSHIFPLYSIHLWMWWFNQSSDLEVLYGTIYLSSTTGSA